MRATDSSRSTAPRGFSLVEMLLAVFILGIGVISIASLFPAGIALQRQATDDLVGPVVAKNALATIRSKLTQEDFGTFEQFRDFAPFGSIGSYPFNANPASITPTSSPANGAIVLPEGDWSWMRPGFVFDDLSTPNTDESAIDIFSAIKTRAGLGITTVPTINLPNAATSATELYAITTGPLRGIPYNRFKYPLYPIAASGGVAGTDFADNYFAQRTIEPAVFFSQAERTYPQGRANFASASSAAPLGQYQWECMFRRYGGRIQVAVFVYRVNLTAASNKPYSVAQNSVYNAQPPAFSSLPTEPPLPARYLAPSYRTGPTALNTNGWPNRATATAAGDEIPGTAAIASVPTAAQFGGDKTWDDWQAPGAWWIDNNGTVHRVLNGRTNAAQGPVKLQRPIPILPRTAVNGFVPTAAYPNYSQQTSTTVATPTGPTNQPIGPNGFVSAIWFIPQRDFDPFSSQPDGSPAVRYTLTPVYATVEEL
jgi:prepilin-type N-terminal cleavage/methylation domain-containing protein